MHGGLGGDLRQPLEPRRQVPKKFRSPSGFMLAGRSTARTIVASMSTADASPRSKALPETASGVQFRAHLLGLHASGATLARAPAVRHDVSSP